MKKKIKRKMGDIIRIYLKNNTFAFGRVLIEPLIAFYNLNSILSFKGVVTKNAPKYLGFSFNIYQVTDTDLPPTIVINEIL